MTNKKQERILLKGDWKDIGVNPDELVEVGTFAANRKEDEDGHFVERYYNLYGKHYTTTENYPTGKRVSDAKILDIVREGLEERDLYLGISQKAIDVGGFTQVWINSGHDVFADLFRRKENDK